VNQQVDLKFAALNTSDVGAARAALTQAEKIRGATVPSAARQAVAQRERLVGVPRKARPSGAG